MCYKCELRRIKTTIYFNAEFQVSSVCMTIMHTINYYVLFECIRTENCNFVTIRCFHHDDARYCLFRRVTHFGNFYGGPKR